MHLFCLCVCLYIVHACKPEKGTESPGTGVTDAYKLAGHQTRGTLQEQQLPLTAVPSLQPLNSVAFIIFDYKYACWYAHRNLSVCGGQRLQIPLEP